MLTTIWHKNSLFARQDDIVVLPHKTGIVPGKDHIVVPGKIFKVRARKADSASFPDSSCRHVKIWGSKSMS